MANIQSTLQYLKEVDLLDYSRSTGDRKRTGLRLADMASRDGLTYAPLGFAAKDVAGRVWHAMHATQTSNGATWIYLLRAEWGSYAGRFPGRNP